jgi:hypothetical protein
MIYPSSPVCLSPIRRAFKSCYKFVNPAAQTFQFSESTLGGLAKLYTVQLESTSPGLSPQFFIRELIQLHSRARRRSWALIATITVLSDISTAPIAGDNKIPWDASTPAASGMATML